MRNKAANDGSGRPPAAAEASRRISIQGFNTIAGRIIGAVSKIQKDGLKIRVLTMSDQFLAALLRVATDFNLLVKEIHEEKCDGLLSKQSAAKFLDVSKTTLDLWVRTGKLKPFGEVQGRRRFRKCDLMKMVDR